MISYITAVDCILRCSDSGGGAGALLYPPSLKQTSSELWRWS